MKKNWSRKRYDAILEDIEASGGWQEIDETELEGDAFAKLDELVQQDQEPEEVPDLEEESIDLVTEKSVVAEIPVEIPVVCEQMVEVPLEEGAIEREDIQEELDGEIEELDEGEDEEEALKILVAAVEAGLGE